MITKALEHQYNYLVFKVSDDVTLQNYYAGLYFLVYNFYFAKEELI